MAAFEQTTSCGLPPFVSLHFPSASCPSPLYVALRAAALSRLLISPPSPLSCQRLCSQLFCPGLLLMSSSSCCPRFRRGSSFCWSDYMTRHGGGTGRPWNKFPFGVCVVGLVKMAWQQAGRGGGTVGWRRGRKEEEGWKNKP